MTDIITDLKRKAKDLYAQARKLDAAIETLQETCEHDWRWTGHGHSEDYYVCTKCGKETAGFEEALFDE